MSKEDRRSKRTEDALLRALGQLLKTKQLHEITVSELVKLADVHRSTFYTHYQDIDSLYRHTEEQFLSVYENVLKESPAHDYTGVFRSILTYAEENQVAAGIFLGVHGEPSFRNRLTDFIIAQYLRISAYEDGVGSISPRWRALAVYHAGGMINLLTSWIQSGFATPKEELLSLYIELDDSLAGLRRKGLGPVGIPQQASQDRRRFC